MKFLNILIIISFISNYVYAQWEYQESGTQISLIDVCFTDSLNGWTIGDKSTILATNNGGKNWNKQHSPDTNRVMKKIHFVDSNNGFIVGDSGLILKTTNSGENWNKIDTIFSYNYTDIFFKDANLGWISGFKETYPHRRTGIILKTINGGLTWEKQIETVSDDLFESIIFMAVAFLNDSVGWALGGNYAENLAPTYVYFTNNGGDNWNNIGIWEHSPIYNIRIINKDTLWAGGIPFILSHNGGKSWFTAQDEEQIIFPEDIAPINNMEGWAIHYNFLTKENKIMYTSDEGQHWQAKLDLTDVPAWALSVGDNYLWIVGANGLIIKKNLLVSSIDEKDDIIKNFELYQNYPNPFNPVTKIKYKLSKRTKIKLSIFDINGKRIADLVNDFQPTGTYYVTFNSLNYNLTSGLYIYKIETGNYSLSKKLIYIK